MRCERVDRAEATGSGIDPSCVPNPSFRFRESAGRTRAGEESGGRETPRGGGEVRPGRGKPRERGTPAWPATWLASREGPGRAESALGEGETGGCGRGGGRTRWGRPKGAERGALAVDPGTGAEPTARFPDPASAASRDLARRARTEQNDTCTRREMDATNRKVEQRSVSRTKSWRTGGLEREQRGRENGKKMKTNMKKKPGPRGYAPGGTRACREKTAFCTTTSRRCVMSQIVRFSTSLVWPRSKS